MRLFDRFSGLAFVPEPIFRVWLIPFVCISKKKSFSIVFGDDLWSFMCELWLFVRKDSDSGIAFVDIFQFFFFWILMYVNLCVLWKHYCEFSVTRPDNDDIYLHSTFFLFFMALIAFLFSARKLCGSAFYRARYQTGNSFVFCGWYTMEFHRRFNHAYKYKTLMCVFLMSFCVFSMQFHRSLETNVLCRIGLFDQNALRPRSILLHDMYWYNRNS